MKPKTKIIIATAVSIIVLSACLFFFLQKTREQIKRMRTLDTMGQISVALDRTLGIKPLDGYDPASETQKLFPSVASTDGQILDGWGKSITISIKRVEKGFQVSLISSGTDRIMGTNDDIRQEDLVLPAPAPGKSEGGK